MEETNAEFSTDDILFMSHIKKDDILFMSHIKKVDKEKTSTQEMILKNFVKIKGDRICFNINEQEKHYVSLKNLLQSSFKEDNITIEFITFLLENNLCSHDLYYYAIGFNNKKIFDFLIEKQTPINIKDIIYTLYPIKENCFYYYSKLMEVFPDKDTAVIKTIKYMGGELSPDIHNALNTFVKAGFNFDINIKVIIELLKIPGGHIAESELVEIEKILNYILDNKYSINELISSKTITYDDFE